MHLTVLTLFPDLIEQVINESITGRARAAGLFSLKTIQIRDFAVNRYGKVDDACYGGGTGMLMMAEPVYHAWLAARAETPDLPVRTIHLSPRGKLFSRTWLGNWLHPSGRWFCCAAITRASTSGFSTKSSTMSYRSETTC
jgi:tRNA (guanine37-N1)-methyltransferase